MRFGRSPLWGSLLVAGLCVGCGRGGPDIARVEGTITLDGKPLPNAAVVFIPENGRPAGGRTDSDGKYVLTFSEGRKGALLGKAKVRVTTQSDPSETADGTPIPAQKEVVPVEYNTQTTLEFNVESGKTNVANFDLKSGGQLPAADTYSQ